MTTTDLATRIPAQLPEAVEQALVNGDLKALKPQERVELYLQVCESLHLNPLTVPFQYITMPNGKMVLYALKSCTDQLRFIHSVNVEIVSRERIDDVYVVTTKATLPNGRTDEEIGAVPIGTAKGEALANALMKASTKAKRRVTLAIVGLSMLDETEIESIRDASQPKFQVTVDRTTGEITEHGSALPPPPDRTQLEQREVDQLLDGLERDYEDATEKVDVKELHEGLSAFWDRLTGAEQADIQKWEKAAVARVKEAPDPEPEPVLA